jgi:hypothetical protein
MEIRYLPDQPVRVTVLNSKDSLQGQIVQMKNRAAILRFEEPVAHHAPIRLDFNDSLVLGQVIACVPDGTSFLVSLEVVDAIAVVSDLTRLVGAVMQRGRSVAPEPAKAARAAV